MPVTLDPGGGGSSWNIIDTYKGSDAQDKGTGSLSAPIGGSASGGFVNSLNNEANTSNPVGAIFAPYDPFWAMLMEGLS